MTDPQTAPIPVPAGAPAPAGPDGEVLVRADGVELLGEVPVRATVARLRWPDAGRGWCSP